MKFEVIKGEVSKEFFILIDIELMSKVNTRGTFILYSAKACENIVHNREYNTVQN